MTKTDEIFSPNRAILVRMLIDAKLLPYLKSADDGCPKCQYIMADHYRNGIGVPKDREKSQSLLQIITHS